MLATLIVRECATLAGDILSMHACMWKVFHTDQCYIAYAFVYTMHA